MIYIITWNILIFIEHIPLFEGFQVSKADEIINQMARRITEIFQPEKIILFGSRARHEDVSDSDVDLLVIVKEVSDRRALRIAIRRAVNGMGLPKDIIVLTTNEFETKRNIPGTIAYPADREGKALYAV
ncbi:MAG: nucleotidyltransferase domain-containing protein [Armatimonadota bacterium]|nr:nucleotidyltransferase domain-containing protein [Armatimonadota bacterium]